MNAQIAFPGGTLDLPEPTRTDLLDSVRDWSDVVETHLAGIRADLARGQVYALPIRALKSAIDHLDRAMVEARRAV